MANNTWVQDRNGAWWWINDDGHEEGPYKGPNNYDPSNRYPSFQYWVKNDDGTWSTASSPAGPKTSSTEYNGPGGSVYTPDPNTPAQATPAAQNPVGTAPAQGTNQTQSQQSAKAQLISDLNAAGFSGADLASLGDWAWSEYLNGVPETQIFLDMRSRPEYQARFPAMAQLEAKGHAISEAQYIDYERQATQILTYAGLGQFTTPQYLSSIIGNEVSLTELSDRIQNGYEAVTNAPQQIRDQFAQWFGPNGDAALAGWFLDANHTEPYIKNAVQEAQAGGYAKFFGFDLTQQGAQLIGQIAPTAQQLISGFQKAQQYLPLTYETISEHTDLTPDQTAAASFGVGGPFDVGGVNSQEAFRQRLEERQAAGRGGGQALQSSGGLIGTGTAQQ